MKVAMLDIETLSTKNTAVVLSMACFAWNTDTELVIRSAIELYDKHNPFYLRLDATAQPSRHIDPKTVIWWMEQGKEAQDEVFSDRKPATNPKQALNLYREWIDSERPEVVYAWPSTFDHVIIQNLHEDYDMKNAVHYRNQHCMKSIIAFHNTPCPPLPPWLVPHNALHDCIRQALWLQACFDNHRMLLEKDLEK